MENTYIWWPDAGVQLSSINEPLSLAIYILCHAYSDKQNYDNDNPMQYARSIQDNNNGNVSAVNTINYQTDVHARHPISNF